MVTNTSNSPKEVKYTGGIRDLTKTVIVNGKKINPIKKFDNPVDAYNDLYNDLHQKLNGKSSWVKPETTLATYISKFAPEEDNNDPKSYTAHMVKYFNGVIGDNSITNGNTLGDIKNKLLQAGLDPEHEFTKAHLGVEDPKTLKALELKKQQTTQSQEVPPKKVEQTYTPPVKITQAKKEVTKETTYADLGEATASSKPLIYTTNYNKNKINTEKAPKEVIKKPALVTKIENNNTQPSTTSELTELISSDIPTSQKIQTIASGISKNLIKEPIAKIESLYDEYFTDKAEYPDAAVSKLRIEAAIQKIKMATDKTFAITKNKETREYFEKLPASSYNDRYDLNKLSFNYRNRNDNKEVVSKGVILQTINPIQTDKTKLKYNPETQQLIVLNKDTEKMEFPKTKEELGKNVAFTTANKYVVTDFDGTTKVKDKEFGTGTYFPVLKTEEGKSIPYLVGASFNDNTRDEGIYGGKLLVISEDGKYKQLFVGSVDKLQKDFYTFKKNTNSNKLTVVQLDEGSYNKPNLLNKKMSKQDWQNYDAQNVAGGHAFYITN